MKRKTRNFYIYINIGLLGLVPFGLICLARHERTTTPRWAIIQDMDKQPYYKPQRPSKLFADGRAMRRHIPGTLAQQDFIYVNQAQVRAHPNNWAKGHVVLKNKTLYDSVLYGQKLVHGQGQWLAHIPIPITKRFVERGRTEFNIFCEPCHGYNGRGNGTVNRWDQRLRKDGSPDAGTWVPPSDLLGPGVKFLSDGLIFNVISNGVGTMASYKDQIPVVDRWAIVSYVRALEKSQKVVPVSKLPYPIRHSLKSLPVKTTGNGKKK
ncbi:MAG: c-type cytochrome [Phycisphaerae bacterium]